MCKLRINFKYWLYSLHSVRANWSKCLCIYLYTIMIIFSLRLSCSTAITQCCIKMQFIYFVSDRAWVFCIFCLHLHLFLVPSRLVNGRGWLLGAWHGAHLIFFFDSLTYFDIDWRKCAYLCSNVLLCILKAYYLLLCINFVDVWGLNSRFFSAKIEIFFTNFRNF